MTRSRKDGLVLLAPDVEIDRVVAVLRRRPKTDVEASNFPESWNGACRVICQGEVGDEEDDLDALQRIVSTQIGQSAVRDIFCPIPLDWLSGNSNESEVVLFYGIYVQSPDFLKRLYKNNSAHLRGELKLLRQDEIGNLRDSEELGADPFEVSGTRGIIVMSSYEAEAVRFAFQNLVKTN